MVRYRSTRSSQVLAEKIGCTQLEADELISHTKNFEKHVRNLRRYYKSEYVEATRRHLQDLRDHASKDRLGRLLGSKPTLSGMAAGMWREYEQANQAFSVFQQANSMSQTGLDGNRALTACLDAMSEARELHTPNEVVEGRRAFESLQPHGSLAGQINTH